MKKQTKRSVRFPSGEDGTGVAYWPDRCFPEGAKTPWGKARWKLSTDGKVWYEDESDGMTEEEWVFCAYGVKINGYEPPDSTEYKKEREAMRKKVYAPVVEIKKREVS